MKNKKLMWLYILSASIYATQGFEGLPGLAFFFYLKEKLGLTPEKLMYISAITTIPWLIKPLEGFFIDNYLSQKKWIILSLIGSIGISLWFGLSPILTIPLIIIMSMIGNFNTAIRDISNDGLACVEGKESNTCNVFQNVQWTSITIAGIFTALAGGYIADHFNYKFAYLCLIPIYLIIMGIISKYKGSAIRETQITQKPPTFIQSILSYKELFTNKSFLFGCLFIFLYNFNPSFGTPLMYIERDIFKWSGTFMGTLGAITSAISILGSILYYKFSKKIDLKKLLYFAVFLGACTTLSYLYFTPISAIVYSIIYSIIGMFIFLNIMTFMARSTISGKEATSFALLCAINNLAGTASTLSGAFLFPKIGLQPLIIVSAFTSFLCIPLISKLNITKEE
jgi:MFS family permease